MTDLKILAVCIGLISTIVAVEMSKAADPYQPECKSLIVQSGCMPITHNGPRFRLRK